MSLFMRTIDLYYILQLSNNKSKKDRFFYRIYVINLDKLPFFTHCYKGNI